jgi:NADH dehydrogenase
MMLNIPTTGNKRVVVIGAGFAGISIAKKLKKKSVQVVLIYKNNYHTFQPLLYQVATGGLESNSIAYPIRRIIKKWKNVFFRMAEVTRIIPEQNVIETNIGELTFDYLIIATGSCPNFFNLTDIQEKLLPLKTIPQALDMRSYIIQNFESALLAESTESEEEFLNIVIVGGGPTGVELAGALAEMKKFILPADYPEIDFSKMHLYLAEASDRLLSSMSESASAKALYYLNKLGVLIFLNTHVKNYDGKYVYYGDNKKLLSETIIWTAGVKGNLIDGLTNQSEKVNRYNVNAYAQVMPYQNIYAVGDVARMISERYPNGHPMLATVAIQQGKIVAENIIRAMNGSPLITFHYFDKGSMATVGKNKAVADFPFLKLSGFMAWFVWMFVHIVSIAGFRNRIVIFTDWIWNYITYERALRLIIRPVKKDTT